MIRERRRPRASSGRRTNVALLALLPVTLATGLFANGIGTDWWLDARVVHGVVATAVALLSPWKSVIVRRGLRRPRARPPWLSLVLLGLVVVTFASGWAHAGGYQGRLGPFTVMQVHIGGAVGALAVAAGHVRSHRFRPRRRDLDRRAFLRTTGLASVAALTWVGVEGAIRAAGLPGADRRFTGSHERGSFDPDALPVTSWLDDRPPVIDADGWTLRLPERELAWADLRALSHDDVTAVLDCTSGWYSNQVWSGVRLDRLVDPGEARSIVVRSATGYARRLPTRDLSRMWLATRLGGRPLSPGHGYPVRLVVPDRRGFWWVKWVTDVELSAWPWWVQLPFPAT